MQEYRKELRMYLNALHMLTSDESQNEKLEGFLDSLVYPLISNWLIHLQRISGQDVLGKLGAFGSQLLHKFNGSDQPYFALAHEALPTMYFNKNIQLSIAFVKLVEARSTSEQGLNGTQIDQTIHSIVNTGIGRLSQNPGLDQWIKQINEESLIDELLLTLKLESEKLGIQIFK